MISLPDSHSFIFSYWGMYVVQTIIHSFVASLIVESALISWKIRTPHLKQWFRIMVILLPISAFPVYQLINPDRGDVYFRLDSLFDSNRLLFFEIWGDVSFLFVFIFLLVLTAVIFVIQEFVPVLADILRKRPDYDEEVIEEMDESLNLKIIEGLEGLPIEMNSIEILNEADFVLFSTTGINPKIYVSTGLIEAFSPEHLKVAFAHEIAHIHRSRRPVLILAYLFRVLMLYNPIAMFEFRRLAQEEEKVCDDIAVSLTGKPDVLIEAIEMLRLSPDELKTKTNGGIDGIVSAVENYSYDILLKSRIKRIREHNQDDIRWWGIPYCLTLALIVCINYFIV